MTDSIPFLQFWLDRMREKDPRARNELIRHSQERFRLLTRQMLRNFPGLRDWEGTSDVLQNVLLRIDQVLKSVEVATPRDFMRLATLQIRRELIDLSRRIDGAEGLATNQAPPGQVGDTLMELADLHGDPHELARWSSRHECIANLPEEARELFELLYYQGMPQADAADLLEIPLRTLERRWQRARTNLMTRLGDDRPD